MKIKLNDNEKKYGFGIGSIIILIIVAIFAGTTQSTPILLNQLICIALVSIAVFIGYLMIRTTAHAK